MNEARFGERNSLNRVFEEYVMNVCVCVQLSLKRQPSARGPVVEMSFCSFPKLGSLSVAF